MSYYGKRCSGMTKTKKTKQNTVKNRKVTTYYRTTVYTYTYTHYTHMTNITKDTTNDQSKHMKQMMRGSKTFVNTSLYTITPSCKAICKLEAHSHIHSDTQLLTTY